MRRDNTSKFRNGLGPSLLQSTVDCGQFENVESARVAVMSYVNSLPPIPIVLNMERPGSEDLLEHFIRKATQASGNAPQYAFVRGGFTGFDSLAITIADSSGSHVNLSELQILVLAPGELRITLHGRTLCNYKNGEVLYPERSLVNSGYIYKFFKPTSLKLAREVMTATGQKPGCQISERDFRAMTYLFALQKIAEKIHDAKHGGCILIVPEKKRPLNVDVKYDCEDKTVWTCLRGKLILHDQYFGTNSGIPVKLETETATSLQSQMQDVENGLRDALDTVARLTAVDGAVIVNRKLELIGFGTVVRLGQTAPYKVFRCGDRRATQKRQIAIESYGTRHRSAFEFCFRNQPSVAIVVSQDGGIKTVTRVGKHIYFWENIFFDASTEI
jgi:hypothetical protein